MDKNHMVIFTIIVSIIILGATYGGYKAGYAEGENLTEVVEKYQNLMMQKVNDDPIVNISTHLAKLAAYENAHGQSELYNELTEYLKQLANKLEANGENIP